MRVDGVRMRADFDELASIGATPAGGVDRPSLGDAHLAARAWFRGRAATAGLETRVDRAGNHSAILRGLETSAAKPPTPGRKTGSPSARGLETSAAKPPTSGRKTGSPSAPLGPGRTLLLGSHLDSVPSGGRYDGALGVIAALHVLLAVQRSGVQLPVALEAIDFTDEEGTLVGLLGSEALAGTLDPASLRAPRGGREALLAGLERAGLREDELGTARREPESLTGYLELHIEQGPVLERSGTQIGVVTTIVGARSHSLLFRGAAGHAGTTPMDARKDAGLAAAAFALGVEELVVRDFPECVATVGDLRLEPGAYNVIPRTACVALEFRSSDVHALDELEGALLARARSEAARRGLELEVTPVGRWEPTPLDPGICDAIEQAAAALGLTSLRLASGAGHDAQALASVTPSGMIFVPSAAGLSHDPGELTPWDDCVNGANVLLGAALALAAGGPLQSGAPQE